VTDTGNSLIVSNQTRELIGADIIRFAERNIVNQPQLPIASGKDCGPNGQALSSFRSQFNSAVMTVGDVCKKYELAVQNDAVARFDPSNNTSAVIMVDAFQSMKGIKEGFGSAFSGHINLPGSAKDWRAFILFHEMEHARDAVNNRVGEGDIGSEYYADMGARQYYQQALKEGIVKDPGVPDAVRGTRVLQEMLRPPSIGDEHNVASLAGLPGVDIHDAESSRLGSDAIDWAKIKVYAEIGKPLIGKDEKELLIVKGTIEAAGYEHWNLDEEGEAEYKKFEGSEFGDDDRSRYKAMKEVLKHAHMTDEVKQRVEKSQEQVIMFAASDQGRDAVKKQPELLYETARKMYLTGQLDSEPLQKVFVGEFVRSAEAYAPGYFKADNRQTFAPAAPQAPQPASAPSWNQKPQLAPAS
jgi:hypothetical protein